MSAALMNQRSSGQHPDPGICQISLSDFSAAVELRNVMGWETLVPAEGS